MKVTVTQEDIDRGYRGNSKRCPIALAMKRLFPEKDVSVGPARATICDPYTPERVDPYESTRTRLFLPEEAVEFIADFDCKGLVEPFTFEIQDDAQEVPIV